MQQLLLGRSDEIATFEQVLRDVTAGRGRVLALVGEPGIGKSTLMAAHAERAADAGVEVLTGAGWEAGGAPPFWPWQQVLRQALRRFPDLAWDNVPGSGELARVVTEWPQRGAQNPALSDPEAGRFAVLDAVSRTLIELSRQRPLLIVLDDFHAVDLASIDLLELFCNEISRVAVGVLTGWRPGAMGQRADAAQRAARIGRRALVRELRRLTAAEVAEWASSAAPALDAAELFARTEGNPLFVAASIRAGVTAGEAGFAIREQLDLLDPSSRAVLADAAVLGREMTMAELLALGSADEDALRAALRAGGEADVLRPFADGWRFSHVLLRDALYDTLPVERRRMLHVAVGRWFARRDAGDSRAAHHLLAGATGEGEVDEALATVALAAERGSEQFAFEEAVELRRKAVDLLDRGVAVASDRVGRVLFALAEALTAAAHNDAAAAVCERIARLARECGDTDLLAQVALLRSAELRTATRDPAMIQRLEEALAAQGDADSSLRARLLARLGAALEPADDLRDLRPRQLAQQGVDMASRIGDDDALLYCMRFLGHTIGYRSGMDTIRQLGIDTCALADRLGKPLDVLDQRCWLPMVHLARGDLAAAEAAHREALALLDRMRHPNHRWRAPILRATWASLRGQFEDAERYVAIATASVDAHPSPRGYVSLMCSRVNLQLMRGDRDPDDELCALVERVTAGFGEGGGGPLAWLLARGGKLREARSILDNPTPIPPALVVSQLYAEAALLLEYRPAVERALAALLQWVDDNPMGFGPSGSMAMVPVAITLGELAALLGRREQAVDLLGRGLALAEKVEAPAAVRRARAALAKLDRTVLAAAVEPVGGVLTVSERGDELVIAWRGREWALPAVKGSAYLAALLRAPEQEIHVADLVGDIDRGDAGEQLDEAAVASYRGRLDELALELAGAEDANDLGRAERVRAEIDAITDELVAGVGLGGRRRRNASRAERARINVQRRIRDAIRRIGEAAPDLAAYLDATIRTGTICCYRPLR